LATVGKENKKEKIDLKDLYSGKQFTSLAASSFLGLF